MSLGAPQATELIRHGETALADHCVLMTRCILMRLRLEGFDSILPVQGRFPAL
jgi:hypothetical protein